MQFYHNKNIIPDLDTLLCMDSLRQIEPYFEAMALNKIDKEMMHNESTTVITYSNDGSSRSSVGSFIVQSLRMVIGGSGVIFACGVEMKVPIAGVSMLFTE